MNKNGYKYVLFDLDGTLTDSGPGIMNCVKYAYEKMHRPVPDSAQLRTFVGPPLWISFEKYGVPKEETDQAVAYFREVYNVTGVFENAPYPGIKELLGSLKAEGRHLYVATSKPERMAKLVLEHFGMAGYFDMICGATEDSSRMNKDDVIGYLLGKVQEQVQAVMVGDTIYDVIGARKKGLPCIGVTWGYGKAEDMKKEGAICIVSDMGQLHDAIRGSEG